MAYTVANLVSRRRTSGKRDFRLYIDDVPPQIKILNMVILILIHVISFLSN